jgi:hypothetical protein
MKTRDKRRLAGRCVDCGGARGDDGTSLRCRRDADDWNRGQASRLAARRRRWKKQGRCIECGGRKENRRRKRCKIHLLLHADQMRVKGDPRRVRPAP